MTFNSAGEGHGAPGCVTARRGGAHGPGPEFGTCSQPAWRRGLTLTGGDGARETWGRVLPHSCVAAGPVERRGPSCGCCRFRVPGSGLSAVPGASQRPAAKSAHGRRKALVKALFIGLTTCPPLSRGWEFGTAGHKLVSSLVSGPSSRAVPTPITPGHRDGPPARHRRTPCGGSRCRPGHLRCPVPLWSPRADVPRSGSSAACVVTSPALPAGLGLSAGRRGSDAAFSGENKCQWVRFGAFVSGTFSAASCLVGAWVAGLPGPSVAWRRD